MPRSLKGVRCPHCKSRATVPYIEEGDKGLVLCKSCRAISDPIAERRRNKVAKLHVDMLNALVAALDWHAEMAKDPNWHTQRSHPMVKLDKAYVAWRTAAEA